MRDMTLKLYSMDFNSAGQRVRTALHLKGLDFEYISIKKLGWDAYRKINPQGLAPTLDVDGRLFAQSTAIFEFIEETWPRPPLLPADPVERARCRAFAQHVACDMHPLHISRVRKYLAGAFGLSEAQTRQWYGHWMATGLAALEETLRRRPRQSTYCFGDRPTMADLYLVPEVMNGRRYGCDMTPYPLVTAIDAACRALPAFQAGMPERQPDFEK
jgi:maleylacetoacetate isomerase